MTTERSTSHSPSIKDSKDRKYSIRLQNDEDKEYTVFLNDKGQERKVLEDDKDLKGVLQAVEEDLESEQPSVQGHEQTFGIPPE